MDLDAVEDAIIARVDRNRIPASSMETTEIFLKVKQKARQGKSFGILIRIPFSIPAAKPTTDEITYRMIHYDIWMHISDFIRPEAICTFALICKQTAQIVRTRRFWLNQLKVYCKCSYIGENLTTENNVILRQKVIEAYFLRYPLFKERLQTGYTTDILLGRSFMQCWNIDSNNVCTLVYEFKTEYKDNNEIIKKDSADTCTEVPDNWEDLKIPAICPPLTIRSIYEGVYLMIVNGSYFIPPPFHLQNRDKLRVVAIRQLLCKDMRCSNLELHFKYLNTQSVIIVKHPEIYQIKIIPWWHTQFSVYMSKI